MIKKVSKVSYHMHDHLSTGKTFHEFLLARFDKNVTFNFKHRSPIQFFFQMEFSMSPCDKKACVFLFLGLFVIMKLSNMQLASHSLRCLCIK